MALARSSSASDVSNKEYINIEFERELQHYVKDNRDKFDKIKEILFSTIDLSKYGYQETDINTDIYYSTTENDRYIYIENVENEENEEKREYVAITFKFNRNFKEICKQYNLNINNISTKDGLIELWKSLYNKFTDNNFKTSIEQYLSNSNNEISTNKSNASRSVKKKKNNNKNHNNNNNNNKNNNNNNINNNNNNNNNNNDINSTSRPRDSQLQ